MPGDFVRFLPGAGGTTVPVTVSESDIGHAEAWDRDIQPLIGRTNRIDAGWRWRRNYLRSALLESAVGRKLAYLRLLTPDANGNAFPIGQVLLADGYPYPSDRSQQCVFLWYLAGAPREAADQARVPDYKGVLAALVDCAIQFSYIRGYDGRMCLHASPAGTIAQRKDLMERYRRVGLYSWGGGWFAGWWRRNDGRYFYADEALALQLSGRLDSFR
jgi:hypothetical protein